jgi:uncharacterized membrane protein YraQ (UPF0718 family)
MTDATQSHAPGRRFDRVWIAVLAMPLIIALFDPAQALETLRFAGKSMTQTGAFIAFAVLAVGYLKASGAESLLARAFEGREVRMIFMAALLGGLSPFCSCEVIPFIAALLAVGAPLSAVMAFWLSSPLMDPAMFAITASALGLDFAIAKTVAAVSMGLLGGGVVYAMKATPVFADPLKPQGGGSGCGCGPSPFKGAPVWKFWGEPSRREVFRDAVIENMLFLGKWLLLAYMIEALMLAYIPASLIASVLGGEGLQPIALGALIGMPAYLNGYAAVPLVQALLSQGMVQGAAMAFVLAGGVSCIPAAIAVWALVKPRVFAAYLGIALTGSFIAGIIWGAVA